MIVKAEKLVFYFKTRLLKQLIFPLVILAVGLFSLKTSAKDDLIIFAASSTTDAISEIILKFKENNLDVKIITSFASSSVLARQIENGANANIFISANNDWMQYLIDRNLINKNYSEFLVSNKLVLIVKKDLENLPNNFNENELLKLLKNNYFAIGDPTHVPAGIYAKSVLTELNLWDKIQSNVVFNADVRSTLVMVERGETIAGIVYATDVYSNDKVKVIEFIPNAVQPDISYPISIIINGDSEIALKFYKFIKNNIAMSIFKQFGFISLKTD